jgi:hypothetical protein
LGFTGAMFGAGWEYVSPEGTSVKASTIAAFGCDYPNTNYGPNRTYEFIAIVDVPEQSTGGHLILNGEWEWTL